MIYADEAINSDYLIALGLHGEPVTVDKDSMRKSESIIAGWNVGHIYVPMQFTGFHDVNRREIYIGDIVTIADSPDTYEVYVNPFSNVTALDNECGQVELHKRYKKCKVVCNIYQYNL